MSDRGRVIFGPAFFVNQQNIESWNHFKRLWYCSRLFAYRSCLRVFTFSRFFSRYRLHWGRSDGDFWHIVKTTANIVQINKSQQNTSDKIIRGW